MLKFSANLSWLFTEVDVPQRIGRAAEAGFEGVEFVFPYQWSKNELAERLEESRLETVVITLPSGDWMAGERGIACIPGREVEFQESVGLGIEYAQALGCSRLTCVTGVSPGAMTAETVHHTLVENLRFAATALEEKGMSLLVEALNEYDMPGYHLTRTRDVVRLFEEIGHQNMWLLYDVYHMQRAEGDLTRTIRDNVGRIAHIHIGDNPGRHEPGTGEINFPNLFRFIEETGYGGWIGCEYRPVGATEEGLGWIRPYLAGHRER